MDYKDCRGSKGCSPYSIAREQLRAKDDLDRRLGSAVEHIDIGEMTPVQLFMVRVIQLNTAGPSACVLNDIRTLISTYQTITPSDIDSTSLVQSIYNILNSQGEEIDILEAALRVTNALWYRKVEEYTYILLEPLLKLLENPEFTNDISLMRIMMNTISNFVIDSDESYKEFTSYGVQHSLLKLFRSAHTEWTVVQCLKFFRNYLEKGYDEGIVMELFPGILEYLGCCGSNECRVAAWEVLIPIISNNDVFNMCKENCIIDKISAQFTPNEFPTLVPFLVIMREYLLKGENRCIETMDMIERIILSFHNSKKSESLNAFACFFDVFITPFTAEFMFDAGFIQSAIEKYSGGSYIEKLASVDAMRCFVASLLNSDKDISDGIRILIDSLELEDDEITKGSLITLADAYACYEFPVTFMDKLEELAGRGLEAAINFLNIL